MLSLRIDFELFGLSPVGYHVVNVAMHALAAWLVTLLARRLLGEAARRRSRPAWSSHCCRHTPRPCRGSSDSGDLLMTVAALAALLGWLTLDGWRRHALVVPAVAAALLTKESAIALPFVLLAAELLFVSTKRVASAVRVLLPEFAVLVGFFLLRLIVRGDLTGGFVGEYRRLGPVRAVGKAAVASLRPLLPGLGDGAGAVLGLTVIVAVVLAVAFAGVERTTWSTLAFLAAGVVLTVAPIAPLGVSLSDTAGRTARLPSIGLRRGRARDGAPAGVRQARDATLEWTALGSARRGRSDVVGGPRRPRPALGRRRQRLPTVHRHRVGLATRPQGRRARLPRQPRRRLRRRATPSVLRWCSCTTGRPEQINELSSVELSSVDDRATVVGGAVSALSRPPTGRGDVVRGGGDERIVVGTRRRRRRSPRTAPRPRFLEESVYGFDAGQSKVSENAPRSPDRSRVPRERGRVR